MRLRTLKRARRGVLARLAYASRYVVPGGRRVPRDPPESVLIVSTTGYGDTLWSIPAISKVRQRYPEAYVAALTSEVSYEILRYQPAIDEFFRYGVRFDALLRWPRLIRQLYSRRFDRTYFLHFSDSSVVSLCLFAQARGFHGAGGTLRGLDGYFDYVAPEIQHDFVERRMTTVGSFDHTEAEKDIQILLGPEDSAAKDDFLRDAGLTARDSRPWIGFQVGSRLAEKRWPSERFVALGQRCRRELDARVFVFGGPGESGLVGRVCAQIADSVQALGPPLTLRAGMALIGDMNAFVTNDTGPMHVALAERIPTVALFGCTPVFSCGHYTHQSHVRAIKSPRDDAGAMGEISVDQVWTALTELLTHYARPSGVRPARARE